MAEEHEDYDKLAEAGGWTPTTGLTIMGLPASVWQRGDEVAVYLPAPEGSTPDKAVALYDGRVIQGPVLAAYLVSSPRKRMLSAHIQGDKAGVIAYLAAQQAERRITALRTSPPYTLRERARLTDEANGLGLAIDVLQSWHLEEGDPDEEGSLADWGTKLAK